MRKALCLVLTLSPLTSFASTAGITQLVTELQASERLAAAAVSASDIPELERQSSKALALAKQMLQDPDRERYISCVSASTSLARIAFSLSTPNSAASALELQDGLGEFTTAMPMCEALLGLPPTRPPNLGRSPR